MSSPSQPEKKPNRTRNIAAIAVAIIVVAAAGVTGGYFLGHNNTTCLSSVGQAQPLLPPPGGGGINYQSSFCSSGSGTSTNGIDVTVMGSVTVYPSGSPVSVTFTSLNITARISSTAQVTSSNTYSVILPGGQSYDVVVSLANNICPAGSVYVPLGVGQFQHNVVATYC